MFCVLEKDRKTYDYLKMVIALVNSRRLRDLQKLDADLHQHEIKLHLRLNRLPENDRQGMMEWIEEHGAGFRDYLNTIKVAAITWCNAEQNQELTWELFERLTDWINSVKVCLDDIHD